MNAAPDNKSLSFLNLDITCKPIGRPSGVKPYGKDNAGDPVKVTAETIFNHSIY